MLSSLRESNEDEDDLYLLTLWSWFHPKSVETALDLNKLPILCERNSNSNNSNLSKLRKSDLS